MAGGRHVLAIYILCFILGVLIGIFLLHFMKSRRGNVRQGHRLPDHSLSSEKGRDLLGSSATPQSPSSASLLSTEGFQLTEKRNGTTTSTTATTLLSNQGNGGHHGNCYSGNLIHSNSSNGHGNAIYANSNCTTSSGGLKSPADVLEADLLDGRTREREGGSPEGGQLGEGDEEDEGLGDGLRDGMKGLEEEEELATSSPTFKSLAPLACEESSI